MSIRFDIRNLLKVYKDQLEHVLPSAHASLVRLKEKTCPSPQFSGWYDWPAKKGFTLVEEIETFCNSMQTVYDCVVVIGIGGSYLGTRAVQNIFTHSHRKSQASGGTPKAIKPIYYAGNDLSEIEMLELLDHLDDMMPIVNVISKSGTTTEPSVAFRILSSYLESRFGAENAAERIIATTDVSKGALLELAKQKGYARFEVPDEVGGRYSVLTAVGMLPLKLAGFPIGELMQGAGSFFAEMDAVLLEPKVANPQDNHPILQYASLRKIAYDFGKRVELLNYHEPRLIYFIEWFKQLFGESEGKNEKGMLPCGMLLTTDLHSLGQFAQEGSNIQLETFLTVEKPVVFDNLSSRSLSVPKGEPLDGLGYLEGRSLSEINKQALLATLLAHADADRPVCRLILDDLRPTSIGYLIGFLETACAISAMLLGVDPFDQPGVEAYKRNLFAIMGKPGYEALSKRLTSRL